MEIIDSHLAQICSTQKNQKQKQNRMNSENLGKWFFSAALKLYSKDSVVSKVKIHIPQLVQFSLK